MSSPRPIAPSSGTPATSVAKRTQRVHWMQRFIEVFTRAPRYLSSTARLFSRNRLLSTPYAMAWSCRSHSPPWSQIGQSSGWLMSRNSITPSRAFFTSLDLVLTSGGSPLGPGRQSRTPQAQLATGLGEPLSSTRHMRKLPSTMSLVMPSIPLRPSCAPRRFPKFRGLHVLPGEGVLARPVRLEMLEPIDRLLHARTVAGRHPP